MADPSDKLYILHQTFQPENNLPSTSYCILALTKENYHQEFWFKATDIVAYLDLDLFQEATNIPDCFQTTWEQLTAHYTVLPEPTDWPADTVFVAEPAVYALIGRSPKPEAIAFQTWIYRRVIPTLRSERQCTLLNQFHYMLKEQERENGDLRHQIEEHKSKAIQARAEALQYQNDLRAIEDHVRPEPDRHQMRTYLEPFLYHILRVYKRTHPVKGKEFIFVRCQLRSAHQSISVVRNKYPSSEHLYTLDFVPNSIQALYDLKEVLHRENKSFESHYNVLWADLKDEEMIQFLKNIVENQCNASQ